MQKRCCFFCDMRVYRSLSKINHNHVCHDIVLFSKFPYISLTFYFAFCFIFILDPIHLPPLVYVLVIRNRPHCIQLRSYDDFLDDVHRLLGETSGKIWITNSSSIAVYNASTPTNTASLRVYIMSCLLIFGVLYLLEFGVSWQSFSILDMMKCG